MFLVGLLVICGTAGAQDASTAQSASPEHKTSTGQGAASAKTAPRTPGTSSQAHGTSAAPAPANKPGRAASGASSPPAKSLHSRYRPERFAGRAGAYYRLVWGIDDLVVKWGESGEVVRFSYRVLDANKAKVVNDKKNEPVLIDPERRVSLVVPSMENVGQLRQSAPPENGKAYWMVFSNKGRLVKRGDHVNVAIGAFHADGLVVD
jgi:hypothetical protein